MEPELLSWAVTRWVLPSGRETADDVSGYELFHFRDCGAGQERAVRVRVSTDQKRHPLFNLSAIEEDNLFVRSA
jgi:hypothetical protein